jgi:tetratricopeptide (TPR) repeat protein
MHRSNEIKRPAGSTAIDSLEQGRIANANKRYAEAEVLFASAYDYYKDHHQLQQLADAAYFRGVNALALGNFAEAHTYLAETCAITPTDSLLYALASLYDGVSLRKVAKYHEAVDQLNCAVHSFSREEKSTTKKL